MATNLPYSLADLQDRINTLVNNDVDTPEQGDDDWNLVVNLINQSIGKWESQDVFWDELWSTYTHGSVVANNTTTYSLSSLVDMKKLGGFLQLTLNGVDSEVQFISPEEAQTLPDESKVAYITGNNSDGYTLKLGWTPVTGDGSVGATISFPYYKFADRFNSDSLTAATVEMGDPNFIIYDVAAAKSLMEANNNQFSIYSTEAINSLDRMKVMNEVTAPYNDGQVTDMDWVTGGAVVGE